MTIGLWTSCRPIQSLIILVINKSDSRCAVVRFCHHSYDYRLNWTPLSPITITYYPFPIPHLKDSRTTFKDCWTVFPTLPVCGFCLEASKSSSLIVSKDAPPISIRDTSSHISSGSERDKAYSRAKLVPISYKTAKTDQTLSSSYCLR